MYIFTLTTGKKLQLTDSEVADMKKLIIGIDVIYEPTAKPKVEKKPDGA